MANSPLSVAQHLLTDLEYLYRDGRETTTLGVDYRSRHRTG